MGLTLDQKFEAVSKTYQAYQAAQADLINSETGEAIAPGESVFDETTRQMYVHDPAGRLSKSKVRVVKAKAVK